MTCHIYQKITCISYVRLHLKSCVVEIIPMCTHSIKIGRELIDIVHHHSLYPGRSDDVLYFVWELCLGTLFGKSRKHYGKRRKCWLPPAFSPFPMMFSKTFFLSVVNPFPNKPGFLRVCSTGLLKTQWEKEKLLVTSNFSFSHRVFYSLRELSTIFIKFKIVVCKLFQFGKV